MQTAEILLVNESMSPAPVDVVLFEPSHYYDKQTKQLPLGFIRHCSYGFSRRVIFDREVQVSLRDQWGNHSPAVKASPGSRFRIQSVRGRARLVSLPAAGHQQCIEIMNALPQGAPEIIIRRNGVITAMRSSVVPGEYFSFCIPDEFLARKISYSGQTSRLSELETDGYSSLISMRGVKKGKLLLTGGGAGASAQKYQFTLIATKISTI